MIRRLINEHAQSLPVPSGVDAEALLWAVYRCEKYNKHNRVPRYEKAYAPDGAYFNDFVKKLHDKWGVFAACSYSNFQILFPTAVELGYEGPPLALDHDSVALPYVVRYIYRRCVHTGAKTIEEIADAYNSGTHLDGNVPEGYVKRFKHYYDIHLKELKECRGTTKPQTD